MPSLKPIDNITVHTYDHSYYTINSCIGGYSKINISSNYCFRNNLVIPMSTPYSPFPTNSTTITPIIPPIIPPNNSSTLPST